MFIKRMIFNNLNHMIAGVIPFIYSSMFYIVILIASMFCLLCLVNLFVGIIKDCYRSIKKLIKGSKMFTNIDIYKD